MKTFILSALTLFSTVLSIGGTGIFPNLHCNSNDMVNLCSSAMVDRCYDCVYNGEERFNDVCVPIFHKHLGTLDNFPAQEWNCTIYRPEIKEHENNMDKFVHNVCELDKIMSDVCNHENKDGICMIANYINDLCQKDEQENKEKFSVESFQTLGYESPWGPLSDCNQWFYKEICTNKVAKFCFDCRKFIGKELFTRVSKYSYYCSPFYKDMNEKETVDWLSKEKYECKIWNNPNYKPSMAVESFSSAGLYPACSGPVCSKEGWTFQKTMFGKDWCGLGKCIPIGNKFYCNFPVNCRK